jgi:predicted nucleotidyltransferase
MAERTLDEVRAELQVLMPAIKKRFKVESLEIFGSYVRGEQTEKSDVDVLVTFIGSYSLWQLIDVERFLRRKLHMKVDLVPRDSVKPALKNRIFSEATVV